MMLKACLVVVLLLEAVLAQRTWPSAVAGATIKGLSGATCPGTGTTLSACRPYYGFSTTLQGYATTTLLGTGTCARSLNDAFNPANCPPQTGLTEALSPCGWCSSSLDGTANQILDCDSLSMRTRTYATNDITCSGAMLHEQTIDLNKCAVVSITVGATSRNISSQYTAMESCQVLLTKIYLPTDATCSGTAVIESLSGGGTDKCLKSLDTTTYAAIKTATWAEVSSGTTVPALTGSAASPIHAGSPGGSGSSVFSAALAFAATLISAVFLF